VAARRPRSSLISSRSFARIPFHMASPQKGLVVIVCFHAFKASVQPPKRPVESSLSLLFVYASRPRRIPLSPLFSPFSGIIACPIYGIVTPDGVFDALRENLSITFDDLFSHRIFTLSPN
jgi:hypothetical protein